MEWDSRLGPEVSAEKQGACGVDMYGGKTQEFQKTGKMQHLLEKMIPPNYTEFAPDCRHPPRAEPM